MRIRSFHSSVGAVAWLLAAGLTAQGADAPLADAAMGGDLESVRALVAQKSDVNLPQSDGMTALHWVVRQDELAAADLLLKAGADASARNRYGVTVLSLAAANGNAAMIEKLLDAGADANVASPAGETVLMTAARSGNVDAIRTLIDHGVDVNAAEEVHGQTALMWAALENRPGAVRLLVENGAELNTRTVQVGENMPPNPQRPGQSGAGPGISRQRAATAASGGMTALLFAAREGDLDMARLLLDLGAGIDLVSANGTSPLVIATVNNHIELALMLLERGANPNLADSYGRAALFAAVDQRDRTYSSFPDPHPDNVEPLVLIEALLAGGADVNARSNKVPIRGWAQRDGEWVNFDGQTPLVRAALSGDITVMRMLVEHGADASIPTVEGTTALMAAAGIGFSKGETITHSDEALLEAVQLCVELGVDVNAINSNGWTALHGAANRGSDEIIEYLAEHGARLDVADTEGRTPMAFAEGVFLTRIAPERHESTIALLNRLMSSNSASRE